jgi:F0F1-type ATP synthase assembly protein I
MTSIEQIEMKQRKTDSNITQELFRSMSFFFTIGVTIVLSLLIPIGIGWFIDQPERLNSHPLYTLIGFGFGTILAGYNLFRMLRQFQQRSLKRYEEEKDKEA